MGQVGQLIAFRLHSIRIGLPDVARLLLVALENITFHDNLIPVLPTGTTHSNYSSNAYRHYLLYNWNTNILRHYRTVLVVGSLLYM